MSKNYLVKLTPTGKFFFGGDMRFGVNGNEGKFSSYIIETSKMPQQTSLLGMMRFLLLSKDETLFDVKKNCIKENASKESLEALIGASGFSVNENKDANNKFGKIKSLGPCCVYEDGKRYYPAPIDKGFSSINWDADKVVTATINGKEVQLPELKIMEDGEEKLFTGKHYLSSFFMAISPENINVKKDLVYISSGKLMINDYLYSENELFIKDSRIGIDKCYEGKSQTKAFYKQISYRLKDGFCFAFDVKVDEGVNLTEYNKQLVSLGADASSFIFEAVPVEETNCKEDDGLSVVLLSDAYIPKEDIDKCEIRYSINKMRPFRFISTKNSSDTSYYRINGGENAAKRSKRYELYEAGSVFYFEDKDKRSVFCKILEGRNDFNQIGYNKYYIK